MIIKLILMEIRFIIIKANQARLKWSIKGERKVCWGCHWCIRI